MKRSKIDPSRRRSRGSKGAPKRLRGHDTDPGFFEPPTFSRKRSKDSSSHLEDQQIWPPTFEWASARLNGTLQEPTSNAASPASSEMSGPTPLVAHLMLAGNFSREEAESWAQMI